MLTVTFHANQQLKGKTKGLVRLDDRGLQLKGLRWLPCHRAGNGLRQRQQRRPILFHPLREKPSEVLSAFFRKDSLKIAPFRMPATILHHQARKGPPERLLSHLLAQEVKQHGGLLIADSIVMLILFLRELRDRIVPFRGHVEIVALHHQTALVPRLCAISHQFVPVIIGQVRRQTFHPIPAIGAIEDRVADPRMHDLVAERVRLHIMPLDDAASQQGERGHAEPARKEILHYGELLERIGAQQRDIDVQVARGGVEIFLGQMRIVGE